MTPRSRAAGALLLAGLLTLVGCAGGRDAPGDSAAPAVILSDAAIADLARLLQLEDRRAYDPDVFAELRDHPHVEVRRRVALAAGRIGDPAATPLLVGILDRDPAAAVRAEAAFALGLLGDSSATVFDALDRAVPEGWVPAGVGDVPVVVEVLGALGRLGTAGARARVHEALAAAATGESERHRRIAGEALLTVWKFDDGPANVRAAAPYLDAGDPDLRWRAAYALMRGGDPSALRPLLRHRDTDARVMVQTARALGAVATDAAGLAPAALERLTELLRDPHPHVRINAVRALAGYGERAPLTAMTALLHDPDPAVGVAAAGALRALGPRARDALADAATDTRLSIPLRGAILEAVAPLDPVTAMVVMEEWAGGEVQKRYLAARSLAGLPAAAAPELAARLAGDSDRRVALAALAALAQRDGSPADSLRLAAAARRLGALPEPAADARVGSGTQSSPRALSVYQEVIRRYVAAPLAGAPRPRVVIETRHGPITLELLADDAPLTTLNFITLVQQGFYDDGVWHRVIPNFVLQDGAPGGHPDGGPGWSIRDEINRQRYHRGMVGMALSGPDTGGSQWFITHSPQPHLDGGYTVFGRVVEGMGAADAVLQGDLIPRIRVLP